VGREGEGRGRKRKEGEENGRGTKEGGRTVGQSSSNANA
jgi:hypothetical protein